MTTTAQRDLHGVAKASTVSFAGALVNAVLGFALTVLVSRGLGATGAGVFSLAVAVFMTISVAGRLGVDSALVRTLPRLATLGREAEIPSAVGSALVGVGVATTGVAVMLWWEADSVAALVGGHNSDLLRIVAVLLPLATCGYVALAATRGLGSVVPLVTVENLVKPVARCVVVGVALLAGCGVFGVSVAWAGATVLGTGLAAVALWSALGRLNLSSTVHMAQSKTDKIPRHMHSRDGGATTRIELGGKAARELWAFALPRSGAQVCEIVGLHAGVVLAGMLATAADAGVYNAVLRVALAGTLAMQALRLAVAPQLSRLLTAGERRRSEHLHHACTTWIVLISWPMYVLMAIWPEYVLALFGPEFSSGAGALTLLSLVMLVNSGTGNVGTVLLMSGRSGANLGIALFSLTVQIGGAFALYPLCGVFGVVVAKAASVVIENGLMTALVHRHERITTLGPGVRLAGVLALACFGLPALLARAVGVSPTGGTGLWIAVTLAALGATMYLGIIVRKRGILQCAALASILRRKERVMP